MLFKFLDVFVASFLWANYIWYYQELLVLSQYSVQQVRQSVGSEGAALPVPRVTLLLSYVPTRWPLRSSACRSSWTPGLWCWQRP
jgi:hypothetical protein